MLDNLSGHPEHRPDSSAKKALMLAALLVLGMLAYMAGKDKQAPPASVSVPQSATGGVVSEIGVGFRVSGRVAQMFFPEHAQVKQGDVLASLDRTPYEQALAAAKAQLQAAQADYDRPMHLSAGSFSAIEAARANVETAEHSYEAARAELEKRRAQLRTNELDNVYNDDVQNEHDAKLDLERTRRELAQREDEAASHEDREGRKAALQAVQSNVAIAEANLVDTQLLAPSAGTVISRASKPGANVAAGSAVYILSLPRGDTANSQ